MFLTERSMVELKLKQGVSMGNSAKFADHSNGSSLQQKTSELPSRLKSYQAKLGDKSSRRNILSHQS